MKCQNMFSWKKIAYFLLKILSSMHIDNLHEMSKHVFLEKKNCLSSAENFIKHVCLIKFSAEDKQYFFPRKQVLTFHANYLQWRQIYAQGLVSKDLD